MKIYTLQNIENPLWHHWAEGLSMFIEKDGVKLQLNSDELQQLVNALPKTFGGQY
jgi:hypothetical protein